jgi:hypothetical protein
MGETGLTGPHRRKQGKEKGERAELDHSCEKVWAKMELSPCTIGGLEKLL